MTIPLWAVLGIVIALLQALRPLAQERWRGNAMGVAVGNKLVIALGTLPFVILNGLPDNPAFYAGLALTSIMWCVSDIYYFRTVEKFGAGPVSRILPAAIIVSFVLWFAVDPALLATFAQTPWRSAGISLCIVIAALCATRLSRCTVSREAFRTLWPTFAAATIGPIVMKLILEAAPAGQAVFGYVFIEALMMIGYWSLFGLARNLWQRRPALNHDVLTSLTAPATLKASLAIGLIMLVVLNLKSFALIKVDNPAFLVVLAHTDVLWIILIYRLIGRRETSNVRAGLGIVACAAILVLLKSI